MHGVHQPKCCSWTKHICSQRSHNAIWTCTVSHDVDWAWRMVNEMGWELWLPLFRTKDKAHDRADSYCRWLTLHSCYFLQCIHTGTHQCAHLDYRSGQPIAFSVVFLPNNVHLSNIDGPARFPPTATGMMSIVIVEVLSWTGAQTKGSQEVI